MLTEINGLSIETLGARGDLEELDITVMYLGRYECFGVLAHFLPYNASSLVRLDARFETILRLIQSFESMLL